MQRKNPRRLAAIASMTILLGLQGAGATQSAPLARLAALPIDRGTVTTSGLSSGGAMAVQFHAAHSSLIHGIGVLAGAPYLCAEGSIANALGRCMKGGEIPVEALLERADRLAAAGAIDPIANLKDDRVWLYRGAADPFVHVTVADALERYFRVLTQPANVVRIERAGAAHNFPTARTDAATCEASEPPYIGGCGFDGARHLLEHLYGPLANPVAPTQLAPLRAFDQRPYAAAAGSATLADQGWLYVPTGCNEKKAHCRLHVVFHGCKQGASQLGDVFVRGTGYLETAEANRIVLLLPQVKPTTTPLNPLGCWDWWGIEGEDYATRSGRQIRAVRAMVADIMGESR